MVIRHTSSFPFSAAPWVRDGVGPSCFSGSPPAPPPPRPPLLLLLLLSAPALGGALRSAEQEALCPEHLLVDQRLLHPQQEGEELQEPAVHLGQRGPVLLKVPPAGPGQETAVHSVRFLTRLHIMTLLELWSRDIVKGTGVFTWG